LSAARLGAADIIRPITPKKRMTPMILFNVSSTNKPITSIPRSEESNRAECVIKKISSLTGNDLDFVKNDKKMPALESMMAGMPMDISAIVDSNTTDRPEVSERSFEFGGSWIAA
jgi:hypothetical protein